MCFQGKGYSPGFIRNYREIVQALSSGEGDRIPIKVTGQADSICAPCPHKTGEGCVTEGKIQKLDDAHSKALGIKAGDVLEWGTAKELIALKIDLDTFKTICSTCNWQKLGICEGVIKSLRPTL